MKVKSLPLCNICKKEAQPQAAHLGFEDTDIFFCSQCDYWFTFPEPSESDLIKYYNEVYSPKRQSYIGKAYYLTMQRRAKAQVEFIKQNIKGSSLKTIIRNAVDIGCGYGALVDQLNKNEIPAVGFDTDELMINIGKSHGNKNIHYSEFKPNPPFKMFDLITMSHVLEHIKDINNFLKTITSCLNSNGLIYIEVPNSSSDFFEERCDTESHIHFFTENSLKKVLSNTGLEILSCKVSGPKINNKPQKELHKNTFRSLMKHYAEKIENKFTTKTIYDGYYNYYPEDNNGIWIRVLAKKQ